MNSGHKSLHLAYHDFIECVFELRNKMIKKKRDVLDTETKKDTSFCS